MSTLTDSTKEPASERMSFRASLRIKQTIERAAALCGQDMSAFALSAAYEQALATIQAHDVTRLTPEDHQAFFDAMENPPPQTDKLRDAFARHRETVVKR
ncbi:MAG: DUF1778 domain-containing protein [Ectothiorhodospiraceae bacterium]|nr:DUF1778 domain-containing protein [Ectothiorhodospiraceae bacterium]